MYSTSRTCKVLLGNSLEVDLDRTGQSGWLTTKAPPLTLMGDPLALIHDPVPLKRNPP